LKTLKYLLFSFLLFTLATGCVTTAEYKKLEDTNAKNQDMITTCDAEVAQLENKLGIASTEKSDLSKQKGDLSKAVAEMKAALEELQKRKAETEKRLTEFRELMAKFSSLVDAGKLKVKFVNGKMVLALSTDILFPSGSSSLSPQGQAAIKEVTALLSNLKDKNYQIEGHTDNVPILTKKQFNSNWELASARAMSVLSTMLEAGMPANHISIASYGETQPVASNTTKEGKSANRRIAIVVVPDLTGLPGFDELNKLSAEK